MSVKEFVGKNSPTIMLGMGIGCMVGATVKAAAVAPKAHDHAEDLKWELKVDKLTPGQYIKATWKDWVPVVLLGAAGITSTILSHKQMTNRLVAVSTAYTATSNLLAKYTEKVVETIGENKEHKIKDAVAKEMGDEVLAKIPEDKQNLIVVGDNDVLFVDTLTNQVFTSTVAGVKEGVNKCNERMMVNNEMYVSLTDLYDEWGLPKTAISDLIGWNVYSGLIDINIGTTMIVNGKPALCITYDRCPPRYDYSKL